MKLFDKIKKHLTGKKEKSKDVLYKDYPIDKIVKIKVETAEAFDKEGYVYNYPVYEYVYVPCGTRMIETYIKKGEPIECVQITGDRRGRKLSLESVKLGASKETRSRNVLEGLSYLAVFDTEDRLLSSVSKISEDENGNAVFASVGYKVEENFKETRKDIERNVVNNQEYIVMCNGVKCVSGIDLNDYASNCNEASRKEAHIEKLEENGEDLNNFKL